MKLLKDPGGSGWDSFTLDYQVDSPLSAVLAASALAEYRQVLDLLDSPACPFFTAFPFDMYSSHVMSSTETSDENSTFPKAGVHVLMATQTRRACADGCVAQARHDSSAASASFSSRSNHAWLSPTEKRNDPFCM